MELKNNQEHKQRERIIKRLLKWIFFKLTNNKESCMNPIAEIYFESYPILLLIK